MISTKEKWNANVLVMFMVLKNFDKLQEKYLKSVLIEKINKNDWQLCTVNEKI